MIGFNELTLNQATIRIAVQEYLDKRWTETMSGEKMPTVTNVEPVDRLNMTYFKVTLDGGREENKSD